MPRDAAPHHNKADQRSGNTLVARLKQRIARGVALSVRIHEAAKPRLIRICLVVHIVAVQQQARLQPQHIARAQPASGGALVHKQPPYARRFRCRQDDLEAVFAGVAGARQQRIHAVDPRLYGGEWADGRNIAGCCAAQHRRRLRTLVGNHSGVSGDVSDADIVGLRIQARKPIHHGGGVGGVGYEQKALIAAPIHDAVVYDAARCVAYHIVARPPDTQFGGVDAERAVQQGRRAPAAYVQASHMGHVEQPGVVSHGARLLQNASVLNGHRPAAEWHDAPA